MIADHIFKRYSSILPLHRCSDWCYELRAIIYNFLAVFQYSCIPLHNYDASVCRCSLRNAAGRFSTYATERVEKTRLIDVKIDSLTCLTLVVFLSRHEQNRAIFVLHFSVKCSDTIGFCAFWQGHCNN